MYVPAGTWRAGNLIDTQFSKNRFDIWVKHFQRVNVKILHLTISNQVFDCPALCLSWLKMASTNSLMPYQSLFISLCVDTKDVEQQHRESLSYLGQRHKRRTQWIPRDSATTKDQDGNVLREYCFTTCVPLGQVCGLLIELSICMRMTGRRKTSQWVNEQSEETHKPTYDGPTERTNERTNDQSTNEGTNEGSFYITF